MGAHRRWLLMSEPVALMLAIIVASWWLYLRARPTWEFVARHYDDLNTGLFLYVPLLPILWGRGSTREDEVGLDQYGLALDAVPRALAWFVGSLAVLAPVYLAVMHVASWYGPAWFHPSVELHVPKDIAGVAFFQLVQVALPEEFFFRGYAQGRLGLVMGPRWALVWASALFAVAHPLQIGPNALASWARLETFFPGLLFGWLRMRSNSIVAPMLMHWACNLMLFCVIRGG